MPKVPSKKTSTQADDKQGFIPVASLLCNVYPELEKDSGNPLEITGITTGFKSLDDLTKGVHRGDLMVIGARPKMGKTAVIANMAVRTVMAVDAYSIAMISADLSVKQMLMRMLALDSKIDLQKLHMEQRDTDDLRQLAAASGRLSQANMVMGGTLQSLPEMQQRLADIKHGETGLDMVLVDDLQSLAESMGIKRSAKGMAVLMHGLKAIAKELDVVFIVAARLSAAVESRADKRPRMTDLYQSRAIEPEADVVTLIYRDEVYHHKPENEGLMEMIVAKNRRGDTGTTRLVFWSESGRLEELPAEDSKQTDAIFDMFFKAGLQRIDNEKVDIDMSNRGAEIRYLTKDFPNLVLPKRRPVCPIEIDITALSADEKYRDGGWEDLIRTIAATWVEQERFAGRGTIWSWGTPSVNFGYQCFSMFYVVTGMPTGFRKYLKQKIKRLGKHVRTTSDEVIPSLADGWNAMCHIEDGKAWEPLDATLWEEIRVRERDR